jgi:hypothetical protein
MRRSDEKKMNSVHWALASLLLALGCQSGGVGDPCTPEDEFFSDFSGFALGEVTVQSRSYECQTRVCLVNKFQGRVSCPYGTNGDAADPNATKTVDHNLPCILPSFGGHTRAPVRPQLTARQPDVAVYCSCRCSGPDPKGSYCECPSGFECADIGVASQGDANVELSGKYCIRSGSDIDPARVDPTECSVPAVQGGPVGPNELTCGTPPSANQ